MSQPNAFPHPYPTPPQPPYAPAPGGTARRARVTSPLLGWLLIAAGGAGVAGSFGPWASVADVLTVNGTDPGKDGLVTAVLAAAVAVLGALVAIRQGRLWVSIVALVVAALTAAVAGYDAADLTSTDAPGGLGVDVGWGLWLVLAAGVAGSVLSVAAMVRRR